jgi:hypothetical protein
MKKIKRKFVLSAPTDLALPNGEIVQAFDFFRHEDCDIIDGDRCVCCGRKMKDANRGFFVQATTNSFFVPGNAALAVEGNPGSFHSLGFFEIGSDCAKKFPVGFAIKFDSMA